MTHVYDVVVIGAGAMGSAAARALADAGREVVVLEKHQLGHDRGGSHGRTRLFRLEFERIAYLRLADRAQRLWQALESETASRLLTVTGGVEHGVEPAAVDRFRTLFTRLGIDHAVLDPDEAVERWPGMRFETPVMYQPSAGCLHADRILEVLQRLAMSRGAEFRPHQPVAGLRVLATGDGAGAGTVEVETPSERLRARHVVATVGSWAPGLLGRIVPLPKITVTQEQPRFFAPVEASHAWPSFVHWRDGSGQLETAESYGLFESGSGVKVGLHATGPTVSPDSRDFAVEPIADAELLGYVREWFPGLDPDRSTPISCLYDNTETQDFVVDRVGPISFATGFCGQGFKFVPVIAELLRDLAIGAKQTPPQFAVPAH